MAKKETPKPAKRPLPRQAVTSRDVPSGKGGYNTRDMNSRKR